MADPGNEVDKWNHMLEPSATRASRNLVNEQVKYGGLSEEIFSNSASFL